MCIQDIFLGSEGRVFISQEKSFSAFWDCNGNLLPVFQPKGMCFDHRQRAIFSTWAQQQSSTRPLQPATSRSGGSWVLVSLAWARFLSGLWGGLILLSFNKYVNYSALMYILPLLSHLSIHGKRLHETCMKSKRHCQTSVEGQLWNDPWLCWDYYFFSSSQTSLFIYAHV